MSDEKKSRKNKILVVDDDPKIRRLVELKLDHAGFEIRTAASGLEALDVIAQHGLPHLAIVDIMMPGMDGFETCQHLKENEQTCEIPVIFMTALEDTAD